MVWPIKMTPVRVVPRQKPPKQKPNVAPTGKKMALRQHCIDRAKNDAATFFKAADSESFFAVFNRGVDGVEFPPGHIEGYGRTMGTDDDPFKEDSDWDADKTLQVRTTHSAIQFRDVASDSVWHLWRIDAREWAKGGEFPRVHVNPPPLNPDADMIAAIGLLDTGVWTTVQYVEPSPDDATYSRIFGYPDAGAVTYYEPEPEDDFG